MDALSTVDGSPTPSLACDVTLDFYLDEQLSLEELPQRRQIGLGLKAAGPWVLAQEDGDSAPRDLEHLPFEKSASENFC